MAADAAAQEAASARIVSVLQKFAPTELTSVDVLVCRSIGSPLAALAQVVARLGFEPGTASVTVTPGPLAVSPIVGQKTPKRTLYLRLTLANALNPKPVETPETKGVRDGGPLAGGGATLFVQRATETLLVELMEAVVGADDVLARAHVSLRRLVAGTAKRPTVALIATDGRVFGTIALGLMATGFSSPRAFEEETEEHYRRRLLKMRQRYPAAGSCDAVDPALDQHPDWEAMMKALVAKHGPEPGTYVLSFTVCACRDLPRAGTFDMGDPYVVLQLGHQTVRTKTMKANLAPSYNETFTLDVWDPLSDVVSVTVMDEDVDEDDLMCSTQVAVFGVAQGAARELWVPLVKEPGTAAAKAAGHIRVSLRTSTFGAGVVAADAAAQEAASARIVSVLQKFAPTELTTVDTLISRFPADPELAVQLVVARYGFEPGSVRCSIAVGAVTPEPGTKILLGSGVYVKVAPTGLEHDAKSSRRFRDPSGAAGGRLLLVADTVTFDLQSARDSFTLRVKVKSGLAKRTVAAIVVPVGALTPGTTYPLPVFATENGAVVARVDVTVTYSTASMLPVHPRLSLMDPVHLSAIVSRVGSTMTSAWSRLLPAAAAGSAALHASEAPDVHPAANALVLLSEFARTDRSSPLLSIAACAPDWNSTSRSNRGDDARLLCVRVLACRGLPKMDTFGSCDAFVQAALSTTCSSRVIAGETLPVFNTYNPDFSPEQRNELVFVIAAPPGGGPLRPAAASASTLPPAEPIALSVWDHDSVGKNDIVGFAQVDWRDQWLRTVQLGSAAPEVAWLPIGGRDGQGDALGVVRGWLVVQFGFLTDACPDLPSPPAVSASPPARTAPDSAMDVQSAVTRLTRFREKYKLRGIQAVHSEVVGGALAAHRTHANVVGPIDESRGDVTASFSTLMTKLVTEWGPEPVAP